VAVKALGAPGPVAVAAVLLGAAVHPALRLAERGEAGAAAVAGLAALLVLGLVARARNGRGKLLVATGALGVAIGLGYDGLRGRSGGLTLPPGGGAQRFEESGPGGRSLGLRPLGFEIALDDVAADGTARLETRGTALVVSPSRAASVGGYRLGSPEPVATGDARALRLRIEGTSGAREVRVTPGEEVRSEDLSVEIERYFPDFALDAANEPLSRSAEPRNPAALLRVQRGASLFRVFVLKAMPRIHRQEGLPETFALVAVEPEQGVRLGVFYEPATPVVGLGVLLVAAGVLLGLVRG
jgi:hypothetical protein